jgi:hypothetical protein
MTAPLQQPTGDRHQIGGVEWRFCRENDAWFSFAHGHVISIWPGFKPEQRARWFDYDASPRVLRNASSLAHAMRNALRWARANPVTHRPAVRRARAEFARLVGT